MGQSLASLLDVPSLPEFSKAILSVVAELDALDDGQPIGGKAVVSWTRLSESDVGLVEGRGEVCETGVHLWRDLPEL